MQSGLGKLDKWIIEFKTKNTGINPLMGWESSTDTLSELKLEFSTKEFAIDKDDAIEAHVAVYVPTNHIYFGDIHIYPGSKLLFPDMTVQEGVQVFLTGGMAMTERLRVERKKLGANDSGS